MDFEEVVDWISTLAPMFKYEVKATWLSRSEVIRLDMYHRNVAEDTLIHLHSSYTLEFLRYGKPKETLIERLLELTREMNREIRGSYGIG